MLQTSNSAGELGAEVVLSSLSSIASTKLHDIDNDGDLDIVASDSGAESILIFINDGSANFGAPASVTPDETGTTVHQVVDLNGDGYADLLVTDAGAPNKVGYYPQQAGGTFGARVNVPIYGQVVSSLSATDFNGDGVIEIGFTHTNYDDVAFTFFDFNVGWALGQGGGDFGPAIVVQRYDSIMYSMAMPDLDGDGDPDIVVPQRSGPTSVAAFINQDGEDPMRFIAPESRTYTGGDPIELQVYFGLPITVTGTPRIALDLGGETVYAEYASGSGTATHQFVYQVGETDLDLDGVQLADNAIDLNGGTLTDPLGTSALLEFPDTVLDGVIVNAVGPLVQHISRGDSAPTDAASVRFTVEFSEAVEGVDVSDFQVKMFDGDLAGAVIESVSGSGGTYEVTVSAGTGSGVAALSVNENASITDQEGAPLARGYVGGEVYTLRRGVEAPIDMYFTDGHGDYRPVLNDGELSYVLHGDSGVIPDGEVPSGEIYTYVDSTGIVNRAEDDNYDFLGVDANEPLYVIPSTQVPSLPFLGFSGEGVPNGALASYVPDHPNVTSGNASPYIKLEMVDVRSTSGGEFSLWSNPPSWNPSAGVSVYMATSDGVSAADALFLRVGSHGHFNVGFSKPGIYEVDVYASGYLDNDHNGVYDPGKDSYIESGIQTMVFAVDSLGAVDDSFTVLEGETLTGDVSANDDWHEAMGEYTASVETEPANGTLTLHADGTFTYEPDAALTGVDSFVYRLTNERGGFTTATVTLLTHHTPTAVDDAFVVASGSSVYGNVLFNDFDVDGDALLAALDAGPTSGSVVVSADGSFVYTPSAAFDDSDSFTYSIDDGTGLTSTATVVISAAEDAEFEVVLTEGHVDIGVVIGEHDHDEDEDDHDDDDDHDHEEEAEWDLHVHDHEGEVEYHADEALLYVGMDAITDRPAGTAYDFIGTDAGESVFVLPATENSDLLFLGLGTEEIEVGTFLDGTLELRLKSVSGPGQFSMWTSGLEGPEVAMATSDGITEADLITLLEAGHAHANFGFTEMGLYQITLQASGTLADGDVSEDVTYFFKVGNTAEGIEVQNGMTQRSYIDELDVLFGSEDGLDDILTNPDRVQITKYDLNGENGSLLSDAGYSLSANGTRLSFDFGVQGLGGNRNSNAGDGYYEIGIDADGDGEYETYQSFYRLLGDVNGDRKVDAADRMSVMQSMRNQNPEADVNGDGRANSIDFALVSRALGRDLRDGLFDDDEDE